jgi:hypothetical protein
MKMPHGVNIKSMKPDFKKCLPVILEIAMFMRGRESDYPLLSKDTQRVVDQIILSKRLVSKDGNNIRFDDTYSTLHERLKIVMSDENTEACNG